MLFRMLWIRGLIFSVLVPGVVGIVLPSVVDPHAQLRGGIWDAGWLPVAAGTLLYILCLIRFLAAGGTPAVFFARHLRLLIGEEPTGLVSGGPYRFTRNPMYLGVLLVAFGQALLFASARVAAYACAVSVFFHLIVVFVEEPHLRATRGRPYELYCHEVPRWLGLPSSRN
jgi:protein-S-isoprenylcysteine O-methyltransferase Ste14